MLALLVEAITAEIRRDVRAFVKTAVLLTAAAAALLTAAGFALSLLYVWLAQVYGVVPALASIAGGCAALALFLVSVALYRPRVPQAAPAGPAPTIFDVANSTVAAGQRTVEDGVGAMQQGSREAMIAALALAVVTGITLGRKL